MFDFIIDLMMIYIGGLLGDLTDLGTGMTWMNNTSVGN